MKRILPFISLIFVVVCICAAGCTETTPVDSHEEPVDELLPCTYIFSCNVDGAEVSLYDGKVMVARQIVEDGVAFFDLDQDTVVHSATVTAEGYEPAPVTALDQLKRGENKIYYITLKKKIA